MLAVHELEETIIGDLTQFQIDKDAKKVLGHNAVEKILNKLVLGKQIKSLIFEFDEGVTPEAKFAYQCDKLECDIQCKLYDEENCVNLNNQASNQTAKNENVKNLLDTGMSWSEMWINFGQQKYPYDKNFLEVSNYVLTTPISLSNKTTDL